MTQSEDPGLDQAPAALQEGSPPSGGGGVAFPDEPTEADLLDEPPSRSFVDDLRDLASDAQTLFETERAYQGARVSYAVSRGKGVAVNFVLAVGLAYFAAIAAVVGLLLALAPLLTPWGALAVVTLALGLGAFIFFRAGLKQLRRMQGFLKAGSAETAS